MNLHPDVLTDLVILYHAGETSEAPRAMTPLPVDAPDVQRRAIKEIHGALLFRLVISVVTVAAALILLALFLPPARFGHPWLPVAMLVLVFGGAFIALRAHRRGQRLL